MWHKRSGCLHSMKVPDVVGGLVVVCCVSLKNSLSAHLEPEGQLHGQAIIVCDIIRLTIGIHLLYVAHSYSCTWCMNHRIIPSVSGCKSDMFACRWRTASRHTINQNSSLLAKQPLFVSTFGSQLTLTSIMWHKRSGCMHSMKVPEVVGGLVVMFCVSLKNRFTTHYEPESASWPSNYSLRHHLDHNWHTHALCGTFI